MSKLKELNKWIDQQIKSTQPAFGQSEDDLMLRAPAPSAYIGGMNFMLRMIKGKIKELK